MPYAGPYASVALQRADGPANGQTKSCAMSVRCSQGWHFDPLSFWVFVQKPKNPQPKPPQHLGRYLCVTQKPLTEDENPFLLHSKVQKSINFYQKPKKPKNPKPKTQKSRPKQNEIFLGFCHPWLLVPAAGPVNGRHAEVPPTSGLPHSDLARARVRMGRGKN